MRVREIGDGRQRLNGKLATKTGIILDKDLLMIAKDIKEKKEGHVLDRHWKRREGEVDREAQVRDRKDLGIDLNDPKIGVEHQDRGVRGKGVNINLFLWY